MKEIVNMSGSLPPIRKITMRSYNDIDLEISMHPQLRQLNRLGYSFSSELIADMEVGGDGFYQEWTIRKNDDLVYKGKNTYPVGWTIQYEREYKLRKLDI